MHLKDVTFSGINLFKWLGLVLLKMLVANRMKILTAMNLASPCTFEKKHLDKVLL